MPLLRILISVFFAAAGLIFLAPGSAHAQESGQVYISGRRYLDLNIHALDKYARRLERTQKNLLCKLKRKERRLERQLRHKDSAAYARYKADPLTYDSIARLAAARPDSATLAARALRTGDKAVDTLKGVYNFVQSKATALTGGAASAAGAAGLDGYPAQIGGLGDRLSYDQYISGLTSQRATSLEGIAGGNSTVTGMQKELFYAKSKIAEWKKIAEDPTKAEELALEYLQGTKGFNLNGGVSGGSGGGGQAPSGNVSADDLEAMGFQTKRQVMAGLQQKYGSSLGSVQTNLGGEVDKWQGEAQSLEGQVRETSQSLQGLRNTAKPKFKINPVRGLPFWKRVEKSWGFQTTRAAADGGPAVLQAAGMAGYKVSAKVSAGVGAAVHVGLGQSWSQIRFTFEGVGLRSYAAWQWQYGIGVYGGYERTYKNAAFDGDTTGNNNNRGGLESIRHDRAHYSEALLLGVSKTYRVNAKWNGAVQALYDFWWKEKGLRSPLVLRFTTQSR